MKKVILLLEKLIQQVEETLSDPLMTNAEVITNVAFYDYWSGDSQSYSLNKIVKLFNGELYRVVQAHTSQPTWSPELVPALFTHIVPPGTIGVWVQPTGAQDAYNIGDQVHFPTITDPVYESLINANTWSPTDYPAGWQLI